MTPSKLKQQLPPQATAVSVAVTDASPGANDDAIPAAVPNDLRNPLWIIAIGMTWFFGSVAKSIRDPLPPFCNPSEIADIWNRRVNAMTPKLTA